MNDATIKILLVEDEPPHVKLLRRSFANSAEYDLSVVGTLNEARESVTRSLPDLLIIDLLLPDGHGLDLLNDPVDPQQVPFIVLTSHGNERTAVDALKRGAMDYVVKSKDLLNDMPHICQRTLREWGHIQERKRAEQALRRSEEQFRQITEYINEVFWLTDWITKKVLYVSPAYEKTWGRTVEALDANPLEWTDAIHPEDHDRVEKSFSETAAQGGWVEEYRIVRPDGSERWISDRAFPIADESGTVVRLAGIAEDITARKHAEEQLRQREAELAHVTRVSTMGEMASAMAHEINQPLAAIATYSGRCATLLENNQGNKMDLSTILHNIDDEAHRASGIIKRLRTFVGKNASSHSSVDVNALINESESLLAVTDDWRRTTVRHEFDESLPIIQADAIQLQQVLINLLRNASEALIDLDPKDRIVTVRSRTKEKSILIEISNQGDAIPDELHEQIFEPFYTTKAAGLGMGLSVSRTIIRHHEGRLWVTSSENSGTTFHVTLPVYELP